MKFDITKRMVVVDDAIEATANPRHRAILENYRRHATLEVCGMWEQILTPDMTVPHPVYRIHNQERFTFADGMEAVKQIYSRMVASGSTVIYHTDEYIMVSDVGLMTEYTSHRFWPGKNLMASLGIDLPNPDGHYIVRQKLVNFFTYDEHALLMEERVYHGADRTIDPCLPEELVTLEEARQKLLPRLRSVESYQFRAA
jgi:hypothetical protein